jgi:FtsH-binding integral membrane protein
VAERAPAPGPRPAARQPGIREVLLVAAVVVALVLAAAALTAVLPSEVQGVVFHTPLLIVVLVAGTAIVLWRILRTPNG